MIEWILSSSAVILIVIALRGLFKGRISLWLQYALWAVVLVRLLVPFSLFETGISIQNLYQTAMKVPEVRQTFESLAQYDKAYETARGWSSRMDYFDSVDYARQEAQKALFADIYLEAVGNSSDENDTALRQQTQQQVDAISNLSLFLAVLRYVWIAGMIVVACVLLLSNIHFSLLLSQNRKYLDWHEVPLCVYVTDVVSTPCLFGWHPAIYLTEEVTADPRMCRHVITHEMTHYRHKDHIWSILRCVCLVLHWYNPLVWAAAVLSKQDAELACDEATIRSLGEGERASYGRTLVGMTCVRSDPSGLLLAATTMTGSKNTLAERITLLAAKPRTAFLALTACMLVISLAVGCTFTGAAPEPSSPDYTNVEWPAFQKEGYFHPFTDEEIAAAEAAALELIGEEVVWVKYDPYMTANWTPDQIFYQTDEEYVHAMQNYIIVTYCVDTGSRSAFEPRYDYRLYVLNRKDPGSPWTERTHYHGFYGTYGNRELMSAQELQRYSMVGDVVAGYKNGMDGAELVVRTETGFEFVWLDSSYFIPEGRELLPSEMEGFEALFAHSTGMDNWYNFALKSHYETPADVDLLEMFYSAPRQEVTQAEIDGIENPHNVVHKYPVSMINEALTQVFGITIDETNLVGTGRMTYLEEFDSYYHVHGNQVVMHYNFELGVEKEDGTIKLYYRRSEDHTGLYYPYDSDACVTLEPQPDGTYRILSNLPVNWQIDPDAKAFQ